MYVQVQVERVCVSRDVSGADCTVPVGGDDHESFMMTRRCPAADCYFTARPLSPALPRLLFMYCSRVKRVRSELL